MKYVLTLKRLKHIRQIGLNNKGKKFLKEKKGENHHLWKGNIIGYRGIHHWIKRELGQPRFCEECGNRDLKHRQYHWSNIDGNYKRKLSDWRRLCVKCHQKYDKEHGMWKNSTGRPRKSKQIYVN